MPIYIPVCREGLCYVLTGISDGGDGGWSLLEPGEDGGVSWERVETERNGDVGDWEQQHNRENNNNQLGRTAAVLLHRLYVFFFSLGAGGYLLRFEGLRASFGGTFIFYFFSTLNICCILIN